MILDIPPTTAQMIVAKAQRYGVTVDELLYDFACDDEVYFNLDRMKHAMKGLETPEDRAKNTTEVPDWALADLASFNKWLATP